MDRLTAMETFVSVVEARSFSSAARRLRVGQPAVSKSIAQLESRLGVRLFVRTTRNLTPTEAGQQFYERAMAAIAAADEAEHQARGVSASLSGTLRVSAPVTFTRLHVVPALHAFLARHPALRLDLVLDDRRTDLLAEGIDVALRLGVLEDAGSMTARRIGESPRFVIATPKYFRTAGVPRTPADLVEHESIIYDQQSGGATWTFTRGSAEQPVTLSGRLRISAAEGVRESVFAGAGLTIASQWMFAPELKSGAVRSVLTDWTLPSMLLWCVFPAGSLVSARARAFVAFVEQTLSHHSTRE